MKLFPAAILAALILFPPPGGAADFDGDLRDDIAVFRPAEGLWAVRGVTRLYFGREGDLPQPGYYTGGNWVDIAVFRNSTGLWAVRDITRAYFGSSGDIPRPGDYAGSGSADLAVYRETSGLWAVRGVTRAYFGRAGDMPIEGGAGQRLYDYVVKPGDGDDLSAALQSAAYRSVFIPKGNYPVPSDLHVNGVSLITGAGRGDTWILLADGCRVFLETGGGVSVEKLSVRYGGGGGGQIQVGGLAGSTSFLGVDVHDSAGHGFSAMSGAENISFVDCQALAAARHGFYNFSTGGGFANCIAQNCGGVGYHTCGSLANCLADGGGSAVGGFRDCSQLANCSASGGGDGFNECHEIATGEAVGNTDYGFANCSYVSASYAESNGTDWFNCTHTAACND